MGQIRRPVFAFKGQPTAGSEPKVWPSLGSLFARHASEILTVTETESAPESVGATVSESVTKSVAVTETESVAVFATRAPGCRTADPRPQMPDTGRPIPDPRRPNPDPNP